MDSILSLNWNNPKAPNKFRDNITKFWSADKVVNFEKFIDRKRYQQSIMSVIQRFLPEIKNGGHSILDMSCGSGMFLELSRAYDNEILGSNEPIPCVYAPLLKSQKIPFVLVDGNILPYPFEDRSFDIVTLMNAIWFFPEDLWVPIVIELFRISRKTVFIITSTEDKYAKGSEKIDKIILPHGWEKTDTSHINYIRWEYRG